MALKTRIIDGLGNAHEAHVTSENAFLVTEYPCPPLLPQKNKIFRQYLTTDGTSTGTYDMQVTASLTDFVDYFIPADDDADRYITAVSFMITDAAAVLNKFGNIAALTNGCVFKYETSSDEVTIHGALKSNWDFVRMCLGAPAFGDAASAFRATNVIGADEAFIPVFNFLAIMPPYGIKLDRGTSQRLTLRIRDDTTGVDAFDAIAYGFERFE